MTSRKRYRVPCPPKPYTLAWHEQERKKRDAERIADTRPIAELAAACGLTIINGRIHSPTRSST